ncbi:MAG: ABC transporter ATP-binding protein, partial [Paramuribaculum sp.]|nr:ABC transporter ATP-binding protein [Paramuribaculum sp.]
LESTQPQENKKPQPEKNKQKTERKRRLSFKERRELESLTDEIDRLTEEKNEIETLFASGNPIDNADAVSKRYNELSGMLDEKELRWLELSELEE